MANYRRAFRPGGTFFLTLVVHGRYALFRSPLARSLLRGSLVATRRDRPFDLVAAVLLPDHLHLLLALPEGDSDFSTRVGAIKGRFTREWLRAGGTEFPQSLSRRKHEYRGVWQKRFWEHCIRDTDDLARILDYIHYNPVKHRLVSCPHDWEWSSFSRHVKLHRYRSDWLCCCAGREIAGNVPADIAGAEMDDS